MGMQMTAAQLLVAKLSNQAFKEPTNGTLADMPDDCPMRLGTSGTAENATTDVSPPCSGCNTCELCTAMASFTHPQFHAMTFTPSTAPAAVPHNFTSADHANRLKPPIS